MGSNAQHSDIDREAAVAAYITTGTFAGAERTTGISRDTIRAWKLRNPTWWEQVAERLRIEYAAEHEAIIRDTMLSSLTELKDRVTNGDHVQGKDGELVRVPVKARDLVIAAGTMFDKLRIILGQPTSISAKADNSAQDKLESLRQAARDSVEGGASHIDARSKTEDSAADPVH